MSFRVGENLELIIFIILAIGAGILFWSGGTEEGEEFLIGSEFKGDSPSSPPAESVALFVYEGRRTIPPNPFLPGKEEIAGELPRPEGLVLKGIISRDEEKLAIIKKGKDTIFAGKNSTFGQWKIAGFFSQYLILKKGEKRVYYFFPLEGD